MYGNQFPYPYQQGYHPTFQHKQEVMKVNGRASAQSIQLPPNSSVLALDNTAPIVWLCVSDGAGMVTATPYDITEHQDTPPINFSDIEMRITNIEQKVEEIINAKSDAKGVKSK